MSQFKITRFFALVKSHAIERKTSYVSFFMVCVVLYYAFLMLILNFNVEAYEYGHQSIVFVSGLFVTGTIMTMRYHDSLSQKNKQLLMLMQPASNVEKLLNMFLYLCVLYPLVYSILMALCNIPLVSFAVEFNNTKFEPLPDAELKNYLFIPFMTSNTGSGIRFDDIGYHLMIFWVYLLWQGLLNTLMLYYKKLINIKVFVSVIVLVVLSGFLVSHATDKPSFLWIGDGDIRRSVFEVLMAFGFWVCMPILVWVSAYHFLKRREVA